MAPAEVQQLFPIIATVDLERSLRFYRDVLGGVVTYTFPGPDGETVYAGLTVGPSDMASVTSRGWARRRGCRRSVSGSTRTIATR
jgi:catechol 2,3-dioxygenase-like lactoylglutathione lyase family enzyme